MELKKSLVISQLKNSFNLIKKNPLKLTYPVLIDLIFLLIYGFFSYIITNRIIYYFYSISGLMMENTETFQNSFLTEGFFSAIMKIPGADAFLKKSLLWILIFVVLVYLLYSFFQALSWRLSLNIAKHKKIVKYMKRFFLINLLWLVFFIIYNIISLTIGFKKYVVARYAEVPDFSIILFIFIALWFYFMFISYPLIERYKVKESIKKTFVFGIKKIKYFIPMYLIIFAFFYIINYLMYYSGNINQKLTLIIGIFVVLPLFAWARLYIYLVVSNVDRA